MGRSKFGMEPDLEDLAAEQDARDSANIGFLPGSREQKEKAAIAAAEKALHIARVNRIIRDNAAGITSENMTAMRPLRLKMKPEGA
jgi:hypothetical protein